MTSAQSVSDQVLESYDQYQQMLANDQKLKQLVDKQSKSRNSILQGLGPVDLTGSHDTNENLNRLDNQYEKIESERIKYLQSKLSWLYQSYPVIFELIVGENPPTRALLNNVLSAYLELNQGKETELSIVKKNMEILRRQNGLPEDFFDWNAYHKSQPI